MIFQSLILVGGLSSRMGTPKHALLQQFDEASQRTHQPLLMLMILRHHDLQLEIGRKVSEIYIAVRDQHQKEDVHRLLAMHRLPQNMHICYVLDDHTVSGPSAGLLAAYSSDENSSWLVTGCDYPLLSVTALRQLFTSHMTENPTLTCFVNSEGFAEPLLAIWTPPALQVLRDLAIRAGYEGRNVGPNRVIQTLQQPSQMHIGASFSGSFRANMIEPSDDSCLKNVNTLEEWHEVQSLLERSQKASERAS